MSESGPMGGSTAGWLVDGGEMGRLIREKDWATTPLGPIDSWPQCLRTLVNLCIASNFPLNLAWGPRHTLLYNDGYRALCGTVHPWALGRGIDEVWASIWPRLRPLFESALAGIPVFLEDQELFIDRNGSPEETFFSFSFSPIRDESGTLVGVLNPCTETTRSVLSGRRSHLLQALTASMTGARSVAEVFTLAAAALGEGPRDIPFALFYLREDPALPPRLISSVGLEPALGAPDDWPLEEACRTGQAVQVWGLQARFGASRCGPYPEPPRGARVLPLTLLGHAEPLALLVLGVSARLYLDEPCLDFHEQLAAALTHALAQVQARQEQREHAEVLAEFDRAKANRVANLYSQHLQEFFSLAPSAIAIVKGPDHVFEFVNAHFAELARGHSLLGRRAREVFPQLAAQGFVYVLDRVYRSGEPFSAQEMHVRLDVGTGPRDIFCNLTYQPLRNLEGQVEGVVCTLFDVTDWVRSREQLAQRAAELEAVIESIPNGVCFSDATGITRANQVALNTPGYDKLPELRTSLKEAAQLALQGETSTRDIPVRHATTAQEHIIHAATAPVRLRETIVGAVSITTDITERKHAEEEREMLLASEQAARREAERANRMKDEFLARISHELATPLVSMRMWLELLQFDERKRPEALAALRQSVKAQTQLVHDLLDTSRALSGKLSVTLEACEPSEPLRAAMADVRPLAEHKGLVLELEQEETPLVLADPGRLRQMVSNLLSNAVKFTPSGGKVSVRMGARWDGVHITVQDTGKGFPAEFRPLLFSSFRQEEEGTTRSSGGLGLGLAIVHQLVELHGGKVWAESAGRGRGATFTLWLPAFEEVGEEDARAQGPEPSGRQLESMRLLVVEDDALTRTGVTSVLEQHGARVVAVENAAFALEALLGEGGFDAMLCDIAMAGEDGYHFIRKVRALDTPTHQLPAAAFTAHMRPGDRLRALAAGFQMHIPKSVDATQLIAYVRMLVRWGATEARRE